MARPLRIEYPGAVYHITSRGNARSEIFFDDEDRRSFLKVLDFVVERFEWICHAYCLMSNHYHLLIETPGANLSRGMRQLNGIFTQRFNKRYDRSGHLFQGRYKAILVDKDEYLLEVARYLMLNPVRAGIAKRPEEYLWSSYRAIMGREKKPGFLTIDELLGRMASNLEDGQKRFKEFIEDGIKNKKSIWEELKGQIYLGKDSFLEGIRKKMADKREGLREIPRKQKDFLKPELSMLFDGLSGTQNKEARNMAIYRAHVEMGYKLSEISNFLNFHYSSISRIVSQVQNKMLKYKT